MVPLSRIVEARDRIRPHVLRTPLVPLDGAPGVYLKLETLQPTGAYKVRGAANSILALSDEARARGVYTASAGNMAQGVALMARRLGIPATALVPDDAPRAKVENVERLGAKTIAVPFERLFQAVLDQSYPGQEGHFVHPVADPNVMAGNGTIGLEILEDLPDVATVYVPYGGGGLSCGIAAALKGSGSRARVVASEASTAAPLAAAFAAGRPVDIEMKRTFIDGIGSRRVLPEMWELARELLAGSVTVAPEEVEDAIRLLLGRHRVLAEGAGASSVAAALKSRAQGGGPVVCVVSGGNLDFSEMARIVL